MEAWAAWAAHARWMAMQCQGWGWRGGVGVRGGGSVAGACCRCQDGCDSSFAGRGVLVGV